MDNRTINRPFSYLQPNMPVRPLGATPFPSGQYLPQPGYVYGTEMPRRESVAAVPSAQYAACPSHGAIVGNTGATGQPQQAPKIPAAKVPSTKTSAVRGAAPRSYVARSYSDPATGRVAALAEKLTASRVSPVGSFSSMMTASGSSSSSSPSEEKGEEEEDDEDVGTEMTEGATSAATTLKFSGNREAFSMLPKWWKDLNLKELSTQTVIVAAVLALIVSFVAMMVIEVIPETRDHHHHHSESEQLSEATEEPPAAKSGGSAVAQERAATSVVTPIPTLTSTLATTRKKVLGLRDDEDDETEATGEPLATSSGSFECDTEACRWQTRLVDEKLNVSVKPCVDFYSYVCSSGWEMNGDLPYRAAGKAFLIKEVTKYLLNHMHALTTAAAESVGRGEHNFLDHSSLVMSLCLKNTVAEEDAKWDGIRGLLQAVGLEGWPYVDSPTPFQLDQVLKLVDRQLAIFPIVHVSLRKVSNSGPYLLHADAPREFLSVQYEMQKTSKSMTYKEIVRRTLTLWKTLPQSKASARTVVQFEAEILEASKPISAKEARDDRVVYTVKDFPPLPTFRVGEYLLHLRGGPNDSVVVVRHSYFEKLPGAVRKWSPQVMLNFLGVRVVALVAPLLPPGSVPQGLLRLGYPSFQHTVNPRTQSCFHLVNRLFPHGFRWILREIVAKTTDLDLQWAASSRHAMSSLTRTYRAGTAWTQGEDLSNTLKRLGGLRVDYLAGRESREKIDAYYAIANTTYDTDNLVGYYGGLLATSLQRYWNSRNGGANYDARFDGRSTDLDVAWTRSPESTYAVYLTSSSVASASLVTRGDLPSTLYPLLSVDVSRALLLSSLYDARWSSWTRERFDSLTKCLVERYKSAVEAAGVSATSDNVDDFAEQIFADNAVIKPLMVAFQRYSHGVPFVPHRAHVKLTALKLFFINYAAAYCATKNEVAHDRERMRYGLSLPPRVRVNAALLDLKEFRDAFKCSKRSTATTTRCPVWNKGDGGLSDSRRRGLRRNFDKVVKR